MLQIRIAGEADYPRVRDFYYALIDSMADAEYSPGWEKDIYPTQEYLIGSIRSGEMRIGEADGELVSCMVVNQRYNEGYLRAEWSVQATDDELRVIHILGVHPAFSGRGIAGQMVRSVIEAAAGMAVRTIRLDVLEGNLPAEKAYTRLGFRFVDVLQMYYEDTGWTNYRLFEYLLPDGKPDDE